MPRGGALASVAALALALALLPAPSARAQSAATRAFPFDSVSLARRARAAQARFEAFRRSHLYRDLADPGGRCDVRVGRFCYWYDPPFDPPPPEDEAVGPARDRLLRDLADLARALPGDDWIAGQRVRYLVEAGRADSAVAVAAGCAGTPWWCEALDGFARHAAGDEPGADGAFARALAAMPETERCLWTDLSPLLDDADADAYRALPCAARDSANRRIWWLADPLYSRPGNEVRTEHYARETMALALEHAETAHGIPWGPDLRELTVRYGWPTHWSRPFGRPGRIEDPPVLGHEPSPSFWLFPAPAMPAPWADPTGVRWDPGAERPPARYALPYATGFAPIGRAQLARFLRRDTTLTVAAFDLRADSVFAGRPARVRVAVSRDADAVAASGPVPGPRGVAVAASGWRPLVASLEATGTDTTRVARLRVMAPPDPAGLAPPLSDLLLFAAGEVGAALPESLEAALAAALPSVTVPRGGKVGLYWEVYPAPEPGYPLEVGVRVVPDRSKSRAPYPLGRPECPAGGPAALTLRWREPPEPPRRGPGRSVVLDLGSLRSGRYVVVVEVLAGRERLGCTGREIRVED